MFIFKRIKKLEDDVSKLKAENEKLHRIVKRAGSEPVAYISESASLYYEYTLYYYKDSTEYSVELSDVPNDIVDFRKIKILKDVNDVVYLDCQTTTINKYYFPQSNIEPERYIIIFDYFLSKYEIHKIDDDLIKVYKDLEVSNEEKEETDN